MEMVSFDNRFYRIMIIIGNPVDAGPPHPSSKVAYWPEKTNAVPHESFTVRL